MSNKKFTIEYVQEYFKEQGCELLEKIYTNCDTKMKYKCNCKNEAQISFYNFKKGTRCNKCGIQRTTEKRKLSYEYICNFFKEQDCELLSTEYINAHKKLKYKCSCGNQSEIVFNSFQQGNRCNKCGTIKASDKLRYSIEYIRNFFIEQNCKLLETEYINSHTPMNYKCKCNNISKISFGSFKSGVRCMTCSGNEKLTLEFVKKFYIEQNCELLETEYINARTPMNYKCKCGNKSKIIFDSFRKGTRCKDCGEEKSAKSSVLFKDYTLQSNKIIRIQGYENIALDELTKVYTEDDIITNRREMPKITYYLNGKVKRYYPDIWIKSENKIIEVKSYYTYKKDLIKNIMKALATRKLKFDFEFWIYDKKQNKLII